MNKAITDGVQFMPAAFEAGLGNWSRGDGVPGSDSYHNVATAAFVPADQDFGGCLELQKTEGVQKLRYKGQTPILPGCYIRVTARIKAMSGNLPSVRIAGWAGSAGSVHVNGLPETDVAVPLTAYGDVVEVSAIIGSGNRPGVDLVWGTEPIYGHFGIDLTGQNGAVVRIDDIQIEDVTQVFYRDLMNWVDVRDYGAVGDGITDDSAAFEAADAAADGKRVLVSKGIYYLGSSVTLENRVQFEGNVIMPDNAILSLTRDFHLPAYIDAFGNEELAFRKAVQSLLNNSDHEGLDLGGRRVSVTSPIDMQAAVNNRTTFAQRRHIRNGQLRAEGGLAWETDVVTSQASYTASKPFTLTNVVNVANIPVGSLVEANGVGREIYVRDRNVAAQQITLSQPLSDAVGTQNYTFTRFKYLLDFSGFDKLTYFSMSDIEFQCNNRASGVLMPPLGGIFQFRDCFFNRPQDRAITSHGSGCQGMLVDRCNFESPENGLAAQDRTVVAITANANDVKLRDNRASQFRHFAVLSGSNNVVTGNHFFQGSTGGVRTAGLVLALRACNTTITGNYVDNCFIEWTNEREPEPDYTGGFGFAGVSITDNVFLAGGVASWFSFIVIKPYGTGHFINGLNVSGNTFRCVDAVMNRIERVDTTYANLEIGHMRKLYFSNNTHHNVEYPTHNPLTVKHRQNTAAQTWQVECAPHLPFNGYAQNVDGVALRGRIANASNAAQYVSPHAFEQKGPNRSQVHLIWPTPVTGTVNVQVRMDK
ncbi:glycosyl hydrolase family 28-related protein [Primorskyibacter marinus]|uniref:glycosyl hydrolase family 28-related protein n=1 Tax=Primorskyibacter marinus TaxID=1977320 RepID=UPI000E30A626|nr:glycosyl hydrolase family 28-related protein [Primorskyibacter marinus]